MRTSTAFPQKLVICRAGSFPESAMSCLDLPDGVVHTHRPSRISQRPPAATCRLLFCRSCLCIVRALFRPPDAPSLAENRQVQARRNVKSSGRCSYRWWRWASHALDLSSLLETRFSAQEFRLTWIIVLLLTAQVACVPSSTANAPDTAGSQQAPLLRRRFGAAAPGSGSTQPLPFPPMAVYRAETN